jgi:hypothetical protein
MLSSGCQEDDRLVTFVGPMKIGPAAPEPPFEGSEADFAAIARLLDRRAAAIERGDRRAFLSTLDPGNPHLRKLQLDVFSNLQDLPVVSIAYRSGDFGAAGAADVGGDDPVVRPDVVELVRLEGVDRLPVANDLDVTFVRRDGSWLLANERDTRAGTFDEPGTRPWYGARIDVTALGRVLVVADRKPEPVTPQLAARASFHLDEISARLQVSSSRRVLIDATTTGQTRFEGAVGEAAAVAYSVSAADGQRIAGWRIKIDPRRIRSLLDSDFLLRHELTHFVAIDLIRVSPLWVREGLAEYVSVQPYAFTDLRYRKSAAKAFRKSDPRIPGAGQFGRNPFMDYLMSHAAVTVLAGLRGIDGLKELFRTYERLSGGVADPHADWATPQALRRVYGIGPKELLRRARVLVGQLF